MPKQEIRFEYKGFPCVVLFQSLGFRCGYVGIPSDSEYYRKHYDEIPVNCHCGLTYTDDRLFGQEELDKWWIGFDCGHACDGWDIEAMEKYFGDDPIVMKHFSFMKKHWEKMNAYSEIRTLEYCIEECKKIVDQLEEIWSD